MRRKLSVSKMFAAALTAAVLLTGCAGNAAGEAEDTTAETTEASEATEETGSEEGALGEYARGISTETGYESEWIGIRYTVPEGLAMSTDEELNEAMDLGQDVLSEDFNEAQLKYAELSTVYEMMSSNAAGTANVIITVEKLPTSGFTADDYINAVKSNLSTVTSITYTIEEETENVQIGGLDWIKLSSVADYNGVSMYQEYYVRVVEDRAIAMALTYIDNSAADAEAILNAFTAY